MPAGDAQILIRLREYCEKYDVPIENIVEVISDLKVIPMIRGKAFEFAASVLLKTTLRDRQWVIENPNINPQLGEHDADIIVSLPPSEKKIRVECKLAKKDSFRIDGETVSFQVKCMRSRTVSDNDRATRMADGYGIPRELLLIHPDNYRQTDFDFVITSLGNAFWDTTTKGQYMFNGINAHFLFLKRIFPTYFDNFSTFQKDTFRFLLYAHSKDIVVATRNRLSCRRRKCIENHTSNTCEFISNYPSVDLRAVVSDSSPWKLLENIETDFRTFLL